MTVPAHGSPDDYAPGPATPAGPAPVAVNVPPGIVLPPGMTEQMQADPAPPQQHQVDAATYDQAAAAARHAAAMQARQSIGPAETPHRPEVPQDMRAEVGVETARAAGQPVVDPGVPADGLPEAANLPDGAIVVTLEGDGGRGVIAILAPDDWPSDANSDLRVGDYESWADGCLVDGYYEEWQRIRPRMKHVNAMFEQYRELTGQDSGKSSRSMRSLRRSARK